ncbi:hypothetical protein ACJMK2_025349 [Sinanodonta woodiana]|uniref:Ubiquitin carboxyl-terminal hydrolase n=1 Tax=Sinanodonta woodiana TaxID=1069815 RepID=A0ABD3XG65_SINWO
MSYRATLYSPVASMPGSTYSTTYNSSYRSRTPSATARKPSYDGSSHRHLYDGSSSLSKMSYGSSASRTLPPGPGPLDASGRKLSNISVGSRQGSGSSFRNGPIKADHSVLSNDYSSSNMYGTLPRKTNYGGTSTSNAISSLRGKRSSSLANINDASSDLQNLRLNGTDHIDSRTDNAGSRLSRRDKYGFEQSTNNDLSRTSSRTSRHSSVATDRFSTSQQDKYTSPHHENENNYGSSTSSKDILEPSDIKRRASVIDSTTGKSLSRQSSSSSLSGGYSNPKYASGGLVGLRNIGNTCFMNSVLQCLSNTRPLLEYILKEDYMLDKNTTISTMKGALMIAYANIMTSMWKDKNTANSYVSPNSFKSQIQKFAPRFTGYAQQDAQEFLRYLLEGLHEDVNKIEKKPKPITIEDNNFSSDSDKAREYWKAYLRCDNSRIVDIFVGQLRSELKFEECGHRSVTFDPFWDLSLPIPKGRSEVDIRDCLQLFMKAEKLDDDERPTCTKCKTRRACTKSFSIQKFPQILVLHLKRFSQERYSRKMSTHVNFPIANLDLREFSAEGNDTQMYNLYAVSEHSGSTHSGHYTAKCKHPYTGEWHSFNDTRVSPCGANQAVSDEAYVLFYELGGKSGQSRL